MDPVTRGYDAVWNYTNKKEAYNTARLKCKTVNCVTIQTGDASTVIVISDDGQTLEFASGSYKDASNKALKNCEKIKSPTATCEVAIVAYGNSEPYEKRWGAVAYDTKTGTGATSENYYTGKEAMRAALSACNTETCVTLAYQENYGAIAMSPEKGLYVGRADGSMQLAEQNAIKGCKKEYKVKTCEIVVRGTSSGLWYIGK